MIYAIGINKIKQISISGVRGIAGKSLTPELATNFISGFVYFQLKNRVENNLPLNQTEVSFLFHKLIILNILFKLY